MEFSIESASTEKKRCPLKTKTQTYANRSSKYEHVRSRFECIPKSKNQNSNVYDSGIFCLSIFKKWFLCVG